MTMKKIILFITILFLFLPIATFAERDLSQELSGQILLQVESYGRAWYVYPEDNQRYYLKDGDIAYNIMRDLSLGISNINLAKISMNDKQIFADYTFNSVAYAKLDKNGEVSGSYVDKILPLASLSKLMTALVLMDQNPNWYREITITQEQIDYPKTMVGEDATSEVNLKAGDRVAFIDLWTAMLVSSSNQSALALADSTGLPRSEFVYLMNKKAEELGFTKTKFFDMTGLDAHNVSTPREMALLAKAAFNNSEITTTSKLTDYIINCSGRNIKIVNRNYSLFNFNPDGVKTGFLIEAQRNVALKIGEDIIVVLHALSSKQRNDIIAKLL